MTTKEFEKYGEFVNFREVVGRFELEPGNYIVIPATFNKNEEGRFLLRIFAAKTIEAKYELTPEKNRCYWWTSTQRLDEFRELPDFDPRTDVMTRLQNGSEELIPPRVVDAKLPQYTLPNSTGNEYEVELNGSTKRLSAINHWASHVQQQPKMNFSQKFSMLLIKYDLKIITVITWIIVLFASVTPLTIFPFTSRDPATVRKRFEMICCGKLSKLWWGWLVSGSSWWRYWYFGQGKVPGNTGGIGDGKNGEKPRRMRSS